VPWGPPVGLIPQLTTDPVARQTWCGRHPGLRAVLGHVVSSAGFVQICRHAYLLGRTPQNPRTPSPVRGPHGRDLLPAPKHGGLQPNQSISTRAISTPRMSRRVPLEPPIWGYITRPRGTPSTTLSSVFKALGDGILVPWLYSLVLHCRARGGGEKFECRYLLVKLLGLGW
jgi:hypothetical protein